MSSIVKREEQPPPVQMDPGAMMQAIVEKGITSESVSVMKDLLEMHREIKRESAKAAFASAFADLRRECGKILATKIIPTSGGGIKGKFAPLTEIQDQIEPLLERHGFFMTFDQSKLEGGQTRVECVVVHRDGHEMRSGFTCREHISPQNSAAQNDGGTNTLAKRIAMCNMFGIRIDYETDARAEGDTITREQAAELERRAGRVYGGDADRMAALLKYAGATAFENIRQAKYTLAMRELSREEAATGTPGTEDRNAPDCPEDAGKWLAGMEARCAAIGKSPSQTAGILSKTYAKYGAKSARDMTPEARASAWNNAHQVKNVANGESDENGKSGGSSHPASASPSGAFVSPPVPAGEPNPPSGSSTVTAADIDAAFAQGSLLPMPKGGRKK